MILETYHWWGTRAAVDREHKDLHISSRNSAAFPQQRAIFVCADSDGGLLVVSGRGGRPPSGQNSSPDPWRGGDGRIQSPLW